MSRIFKHISITLFTILFSGITFLKCEDSLLLGVIKTEVQKLAQKYPEGWHLLIRDVMASSDFLVDSIPHSELTTTLKYKHKLPQQVIDKFQGIAFSKTVTTQSFSLTIVANRACMEEYIGAAYNEGQIIRLAYSKVMSFGTMIPQYTTTTTQKCFTILFIEKCIPQNTSVERGYTSAELMTIWDTLRANAYLHLNFRIQNLNDKSQFTLLDNQEFWSSNMKYGAVMQRDGNFVIYYKDENNKSTPIWASVTWQYVHGTYQSYSMHVMKTGNLEIHANDYGKDVLLWESKTVGQGEGPHSIVLQDDGNFVLYDKNHKPLWETITGQLLGKSFALPQNCYMFSPNGKYYAILQPDGNLIVYSVNLNNGKEEISPIWASLTNGIGQPPYIVIVETNGNMVIYGNGRSVVYETKTMNKGIAPRTVQVTDEGNLVLVDSQKKIIWSSQKGVA